MKFHRVAVILKRWLFFGILISSVANGKVLIRVSERCVHLLSKTEIARVTYASDRVSEDALYSYAIQPSAEGLARIELERRKAAWSLPWLETKHPPELREIRFFEPSDLYYYVFEIENYLSEGHALEDFQTLALVIRSHGREFEVVTEYDSRILASRIVVQIID